VRSSCTLVPLTVPPYVLLRCSKTPVAVRLLPLWVIERPKLSEVPVTCWNTGGPRGCASPLARHSPPLILVCVSWPVQSPATCAIDGAVAAGGGAAGLVDEPLLQATQFTMSIDAIS